MRLPPVACLAVEDSRPGFLAAHAAGVPTLIPSTPIAQTQTAAAR
ncbi:hypothetical protein [Candidatus Accumulibacter sp. ACC003]|nr:hypothetical protein [Candidatus Accumulibacter sp. ACC003]